MDTSEHAAEIFGTLRYTHSSLMGVVAKHKFPSGYGVSVCRLLENENTEDYTHAYEVMLTYCNELLHAPCTPITHGESVRCDTAFEVIDLINQALQLPSS